LLKARKITENNTALRERERERGETGTGTERKKETAANSKRKEE
jgi:hypothetical protein